MASLSTAERKQLFDTEFPKVVKGMVRPDSAIPTDFPFSADVPQYIRTDPCLFSQDNLILRQLLSNDLILDAVIKAIQGQLASCDLRLVTQALKGLMSPSDKTKLDGIQAGATNYAHPAAHPATMITPDATHRFTTDAEKNAWNGKANASHGTHIPAPQGANNGIFLRNDNTWQYVTPSGIGAYTKGEIDGKVNTINGAINGKANTSHGNHVPATQTANNAIFLRNDDTWQAVTPGNIGAYAKGEIDTKVNAINTAINGKAATSHGTHVPGGGSTSSFLRGDNTWQALSAMGGIVGGSLAQNGWVKFANGLILQWGYYNNGSSKQSITVAYPIAFTTCFIVIGNCLRAWNSGGGEGSNYINSISSTSFGFYRDGAGPYWLAIGK